MLSEISQTPKEKYCMVTLIQGPWSRGFIDTRAPRASSDGGKSQVQAGVQTPHKWGRWGNSTHAIEVTETLAGRDIKNQ
jgi:hypothetical protein